MVDKDYYNILGVSKDITPEELKKVYRKLAIKYHPDKNPGNSVAENKFKDISEAYDTLGNPEKKYAYDNNRISNGFPFGGGFNPFTNTPFSTNMRGQRNVARRGHDIKLILKVSFSKLLFGGEELFNINYDEPCLECNGGGASKSETCTKCGGQGIIFIKDPHMGQIANMMFSAPCHECKGTGQRMLEPCKVCSGIGVKHVKNKEFKLNIPPNTRDGMVLKLTEHGPRGINGGPAGDILIKVQMQWPDISKLTKEERDVLQKL